MVTITVRTGDGKETAVEAEDGYSVTEATRDNGFDELLAFCSGPGDRRESATLPVNPWLWSDPCDLKLQSIGLSQGPHDLVVRGDPASRGFSVVYLRGGKVVALDSVNNSKDFTQGKALIQKGTAASFAALANPSVQLKPPIDELCGIKEATAI